MPETLSNFSKIIESALLKQNGMICVENTEISLDEVVDQCNARGGGISLSNDDDIFEQIGSGNIVKAGIVVVDIRSLSEIDTTQFELTVQTLFNAGKKPKIIVLSKPGQTNRSANRRESVSNRLYYTDIAL